jgi:hypothetical protein
MEKKDEKDRPRISKRPQRYRFFLNPYQDVRFSKCPQCTNKTGQRKLPLFIHIPPDQPVFLNKTCRYCAHCDLLIAHRNELDKLVKHILTMINSELPGDEYLVVGTVDRPVWKRIREENIPPHEWVEMVYIFKEAVTFTPVGGWG